MEPIEDRKQNRLATQVGWPAFKRARRLKGPTKSKRSSEFPKKSVNEFSCDSKMSKSSGQPRAEATTSSRSQQARRPHSLSLKTFAISLLLLELLSELHVQHNKPRPQRTAFISTVSASLIIGDSAIEIQEVDQSSNVPQNAQVQSQQQLEQQQQQRGSDLGIILGSTSDDQRQQQLAQNERPQLELGGAPEHELQAGQPASSGTGFMSRSPSGPLPPLVKPGEDITDGDQKSRDHHDYDLSELKSRENEREALSGSLEPDKTITGAVVDFELQPAGGHNKAKIKKKKKKKMMEKKEAAFKKWDKKKKMEKKAMEKEEKKHMKKKKEEGKKKKKKWGVEVHGQKKKGAFKKKKWGKKVKKGHGIKKGKKGKKFLKDKGHKNTGFKTVYHKEEWGKTNKWHDIKREKKWDEKAKKWKNKWKKEKGKKYKGEHMKKFEKKKKEGKKYKKAKKEKYKKFKKEEFEKGKKKKMEEHKKKKEGGAKKEEKELKKKKKKKKP